MSDAEILFHDEHLLALDKPPGLLTVPGIGPGRQDCLIARVQRTFPTARIVHRLDRDTSGVILLALDAETHRELSRMFHDREVRKTYVAIVAGTLATEAGEINLPMRKDLDAARATGVPRHIIDHEQGRPAETHWRVMKRWAASPTVPLPVSRVALQPITGRSHQLRVHMSAIGCPILGDDIYAPPAIRDAAERLLLHAESLQLADPWSAAPLRFTAPCPF